MKKALIILFVFTAVVFAKGKYELSISSASYKGMEKGFAYTEVYLSYARHNMTFVKNDDGTHSGSARIDFILRDFSGKIIDEGQFNRNFKISKGYAPNAPYHMIDLFPEKLAPGKYQVDVTVKDNYADERGETKSFEIDIPDYWQETPMISDIFLIGMVGEPDSSIFTRYGLKLLPYPRAEYTPRFPLMQYANEIYNYTEDDKLNIYIVKGGSIIREVKNKDIPEGGISVSQINVAGLPEGNYKLIVKMVDKYDKVVDSKSHKFSVIKDEGGIPDSILVEQADMVTDMMPFLLNNKEMGTFKKLKDKGKIEYWNRYWVDEHKITKEDFLNNWTYVVKAFETAPGMADGHKTDMGKVYMAQGSPDFIERNPMSTESNQWEKWTYQSKEINGYVIFGDERNIGEMKIMHSTISGYKYDTDWLSKLSRND